MADKNDYIKEPRWYVAHTYSGYEKKVLSSIEKAVQNRHLEDSIMKALVPTEEVIEVKNGKQKIAHKKLFPGYVLLYMIMNEKSWFVVRNIRGVTGFVGPESKPVPLTPEEMAPFGIREDGTILENDEMPKFVIDVEVGERVKIIDGDWKGKGEGTVRGLDDETGTALVGIEIIEGRETVVEVDYLDIQKM